LIDEHDGQISLTNLALLIVLFKLAIAPAVGLVEIGGLFISLLAYSGKKVINNKQKKETDGATSVVQKQLDDLKDVVSALSIKTGMKR